MLINFQAHIFSREKEQIREKKGETTIDIISDITQIVGKEQKIRFKLTTMTASQPESENDS